MDLSGKKAVVFGGTSGIGLATSLLLAGDGAEVTAVSRKPDKAGDVPNGISTRACDVLDRSAVEAILDELSPIDILVTAATGGKRAYGPFLEMDLDGYKALSISFGVTRMLFDLELNMSQMVDQLLWCPELLRAIASLVKSPYRLLVEQLKR